MAGRLTVSTLNNDTGVLATQNGMTGIAKAWVNYNGSTQTILSSFNVSSVTYTGTGNYTVNFTTALPNSNYSISGMNNSWGQNYDTQTTSSFRLLPFNTTNGASINPTSVSAIVIST
jgi:hypothetical protein